MSLISVWRGIGIDAEMSGTLSEIRAQLISRGSPPGEDGGKPGIMRGFVLAVPAMDHHVEDPFEIARKVIAEERCLARFDDSDGAVCACGDAGGAHYYATRSSPEGLIIEAAVKVDRLILDGRDFLYSAMVRLVDAPSAKTASLEGRLRLAFGQLIDAYVAAGRTVAIAARQEGDPHRLFRFVDHMTMDLRVIEAHASSRVGLLGRHGTRFMSAFGVLGGIRSDDIRSVVPAGDRSGLPAASVPRAILSLEEVAASCAA